MISTKAFLFSSLMHHFEYYKRSDETLRIAKNKYSWMISDTLSDESIEVRYHLLEYLSQEFWFSGILTQDAHGWPIPISLIQSHEWASHISRFLSLQEPQKQRKLYWSLSHSENYLAFIISDTPTGIDIAEYEERDDALLALHKEEEYALLGGRNWHNFYLLWTAKEAIIKSIWWILDDMKNISVRERTWNLDHFFEFHGSLYTINHIQDSDVFLSYTSS